jgi:hypothetical protein
MLHRAKLSTTDDLRVLAQQCFPRMCTSNKPQNLKPVKVEQGEAENVPEAYLACTSDQDFHKRRQEKPKKS